jgi:hypothetical protein
MNNEAESKASPTTKRPHGAFAAVSRAQLNENRRVRSASFVFCFPLAAKVLPSLKGEGQGTPWGRRSARAAVKLIGLEEIDERHAAAVAAGSVIDMSVGRRKKRDSPKGARACLPRKPGSA